MNQTLINTSNETTTSATWREAMAAFLELIERLAEKFPKTFFVFEQRRKPLKLKIHLDILAAFDGAVTLDELSAAMRLYVSNRCYLWACRVGAERIDLAGEPSGTVTDREAENARRSIAAYAKRKAARAAAAKVDMVVEAAAPSAPPSAPSAFH